MDNSETQITPTIAPDRTPPTTPPHTKNSLIKWGLILLVLVLVIVAFIAALAYQSRTSTPGTSLYSYRVNLWEPALGWTKLSANARADYDLSLMSARLDELKVLANDTASSSTSTLMQIANNSVMRAAATVSVASSQSPEDRINTQSKLVTIMQAEDTLAATTHEFTAIVKQLQEARRTTATTLTSAVQTYASSTPADVSSAFLATHVQVVSQGLKTVAFGSSAQQQAIVRISYMQDALRLGNVAEAILSILKAEQSLAIDGMIYGGEHGDGSEKFDSNAEIPLGS